MAVLPRMTYYTRVIDNVDGHQVFGYASTAKNKKLYYGKVDGLRGGESEYIVEFDIWNNEPAWDGGTPILVVQNAVNCRLTIDIPPESRDLSPFLYARCTTLDPEGSFNDLSMGRRTFTAVRGNVSDELGTILGTSDHATIQTKIKLRKNSTVKYSQYQFALNFEYNYE